LRERWAPWLLSGGILVGVWHFPTLWLLNAPWKSEILADVIAASSILVAYLLTAVTLLPAVEDKAIVQKLRSWQYYGFIVGYIGRAAWAAATLLVLSIFLIPVPDVLSKTASLKVHAALINQAISSVWWATLMLAIAFVFVATRILLKLLRAR
jgi:hypothetical protein